MATTIHVRKLYADDKEYLGKKFIEYKIYTTSGVYYTSRKKFEDFVGEGAALEVEAEPTKNPKYFKLKSVKLLTPVSTSAQAGPAPIIPKTPLPAGQPPIPKPSAAQRVEWIDTALAILKKAGIDPEIESSLLTELVREQHSEWMSDKISAEQKARWGK